MSGVETLVQGGQAVTWLEDPAQSIQQMGPLLGKEAELGPGETDRGGTSHQQKDTAHTGRTPGGTPPVADNPPTPPVVSEPPELICYAFCIFRVPWAIAWDTTRHHQSTCRVAAGGQPMRESPAPLQGSVKATSNCDHNGRCLAHPRARPGSVGATSRRAPAKWGPKL
ncbi:hypothetical protein Bbelb_365620 [Branchiostoma belcheri]|nr:hypothetical protein Bbelb_365620 [Branchiostoma belcheri]